MQDWSTFDSLGTVEQGKPARLVATRFMFRCAEHIPFAEIWRKPVYSVEFRWKSVSMFARGMYGVIFAQLPETSLRQDTDETLP
jgi:hypothetical protein